MDTENSSSVKIEEQNVRHFIWRSKYVYNKMSLNSAQNKKVLDHICKANQNTYLISNTLFRKKLPVMK